MYKSMIQGRKQREKEAWLLNKKRKLHDEQQRKEKKGASNKQVIKKNVKNSVEA